MWKKERYYKIYLSVEAPRRDVEQNNLHADIITFLTENGIYRYVVDYGVGMSDLYYTFHIALGEV